MAYEEIEQQAKKVLEELLEQAKLKRENILVVGCSSSEIMGEHIGKGSSLDAAESVFRGLFPILEKEGIYLAAQCCEHLNRAVIIEKKAVTDEDAIVNVIPQPKAGGSFATTVYHHLQEPVAVESIKADAGIDIGGTLIGMHLKRVAVPLRLSLDTIGAAHIVCARTRPRYIGGSRAKYNEDL